MALQKITPFLWFDKEAEEAATYYTTVFKNSKLGKISRYPEAGQEIHKQKPGTAMTVEFELEGLKFTALNAGPTFKFTEAISFVIHCESQEEVDYFWSKLSAHPENEACGWVKDKFGLSWQITPVRLMQLLNDPDKGVSSRVMNAMMKMKKIDIAELERAAKG